MAGLLLQLWISRGTDLFVQYGHYSELLPHGVLIPLWSTERPFFIPRNGWLGRVSTSPIQGGTRGSHRRSGHGNPAEILHRLSGPVDLFVHCIRYPYATPLYSR